MAVPALHDEASPVPLSIDAPFPTRNEVDVTVRSEEAKEDRMTLREGRPTTGTPCWNDLMSPDVKGAARFYAGLFGWDYDESGPEYGMYHMARVDGRAAAGIGQMPENAAFPSAWTVYFAADDVRAMSERAAALGGTVMMPPMEVPGQGWMAVIVDPVGAAFGLWQGTGHLGTGIEEVHGATVWRDLHTDDIEEARAFYAALLDAEPRPIEGGNTAYYMFVKDGRNIGGIAQTPAAAAGMPSRWLTYFEVADLDVAVDGCTTAGGTVVEPPSDNPFGRMAVVTDPYGATFCLHQSRPRG